MTNSASIDTFSETTIDSLDENQIAEYLRRHPDFFLRHKSLLADVKLPQENHGVVSLTQIQLEQYREKVKQQKKRLEQMIRNAERNEIIYNAYTELNFVLSTNQTLAQIETALHHHFCEKLGLLEASIVLIDNALAEQLPELPQRSLLDKKLANTNYYLGRISTHEQQVLFKSINIGSVAIVKINGIETKETTVKAVLAIASEDASHFSPSMDTSLLDYLRQFLAFHLERILSS